RIQEAERRTLMGGWRRPKRGVRWVTCRADEVEEGTLVTIECSKGSAPGSRALQLVELLSLGNLDQRTIYRDRRIPPGPVSLVASWAGTGYPLFLDPSFEAPRGEEVYTATPIEA